jgi:1-deoxy-D-xylulose-5-phosphate synthase
VFDYSFLRCIPHLIIMAPSDENELRQMLYTGFQHEGPAAVRYPRGSGIGIQPQADMELLPIGKSRTIRTGQQVAILAFGTMLESAQEAAIELDATLVDMRFVKPLDHAVIDALTQNHQLLVTVEENVIAGGAGSAVNDYVAAAGLATNLLNLGIPDEFIQPANPKKMLQACGLDRDSISDAITSRLNYLNEPDGIKKALLLGE